MTTVTAAARGVGPRLDAHQLADLAVTAMLVEADLTPKPGLVDRRGGGAHSDMDVEMLRRSAEALRTALTECARVAAREHTIGSLRTRLGEIGRAGERTMLAATGGVNTHRGALWALGLLTAGAAAAHDGGGAVALAARLAGTPDPGPSAHPPARESHGAAARRRHGASGAIGEAAQGFPHAIRYGIPALRTARRCGRAEDRAQIEALLARMAHLDDTCLLHRGGPDALRAVQAGAAAVLADGGIETRLGRRRFALLDDLCRRRGLSPGGSGDLLSVTVFLDALDQRTEPSCNA